MFLSKSSLFYLLNFFLLLFFRNSVDKILKYSYAYVMQIYTFSAFGKLSPDQRCFLSNLLSPVYTVNRVCMITYKGSLLELCALWAGEQPPPGPGGAHAQQVGVAGGERVSVVAWCLSRTGELIRTVALK